MAARMENIVKVSARVLDLRPRLPIEASVPETKGRKPENAATAGSDLAGISTEAVAVKNAQRKAKSSNQS